MLSGRDDSRLLLSPTPGPQQESPAGSFYSSDHADPGLRWEAEAPLPAVHLGVYHTYRMCGTTQDGKWSLRGIPGRREKAHIFCPGSCIG